MRIALVNPPLKHIIRTHSPKILEHHCYYPPLGLLYIAANLLEHGFEDVHVLDGAVGRNGHKYLHRRLAELRPEIIGISAMTSTIYDTYLLLQFIESELPDTHVTMGGVHVDIYPDDSLALPAVDSIVLGDGEFAMVELARSLQKRNPTLDIPGLWYRLDGQCIQNEPRPINRDLDGLPFPRREMVNAQGTFSTIEENKNIASMITSRGCPFNCIYCYPHERIVRYRSPESVADEIEMCHKQGVQYISFWEYTFNLKRDHALGIARAILDRGLDITWGFRGRIDVFDQEMAETFWQSGCRHFHFGVESSDSSILREVKKQIEPEMASKAVSLCKKFGITSAAYFMIGFPFESREQIEHTLRFSRELDPDYAIFNITTPFPKTELYRMALEAGGIDHDYFAQYAQKPTKVLNLRLWETSLSEKELVRYLKRAYFRFYFRGKFFLNPRTWMLVFDRFFRILFALASLTAHQIQRHRHGSEPK